MTAYRISDLLTGLNIFPSVATDPTGIGVMFLQDSPLADSLTVDAGAFLIGPGAASLASTGAWTVTVNGSMYGGFFGINLISGNAAISKFTIGAEGSVAAGILGDGAALFMGSSSTITNAGAVTGGVVGVKITGGATHTITNTGTIQGSNFAIADAATSKDTITNKGTIIGTVSLGEGDDSLTNSGAINEVPLLAFTAFVDLGNGTNKLTNSGSIKGKDIDGVSVIGRLGADTVSNTKTIAGAITLGEPGGTDTFANVLTNSGTIGKNNTNFSYGGGTGADTITNSGTLDGAVFLGAGANKVTNSGSIGTEGATSIFGGADGDTISNTKTILGIVDLGSGANMLTNSGTIGASVLGGALVDKVTNSGTISGDVILGGDNDVFTNFAKAGTKTISGTVTGIVALGTGNDVFTGGAKSATVKDGDGADKYTFGAGSDTYMATGALPGNDGNDTVTGGTGIDLYSASLATSAVSINLDTVDHTSIGMFPFTLTKNTAIGVDVAGVANKDTITTFENAEGGDGDDVIFGSGLANTLLGNGGGDQLFGFGGNDIINGRTGTDFIIGGTGADTLTGGGDADTFIFDSKTDSGITAATRDTITDFAHLVDIIDISAIVNGASFGYLNDNGSSNSDTTPGAVFTGVLNQMQMRSYWVADGYIFELDTNSDKKADFSFKILDATHTSTITEGDFIV